MDTMSKTKKDLCLLRVYQLKKETNKQIDNFNSVLSAMVGISFGSYTEEHLIQFLDSLIVPLVIYAEYSDLKGKWSCIFKEYHDTKLFFSANTVSMLPEGGKY